MTESAAAAADDADWRSSRTMLSARLCACRARDLAMSSTSSSMLACRAEL